MREKLQNYAEAVHDLHRLASDFPPRPTDTTLHDFAAAVLKTDRALRDLLRAIVDRLEPS